MDKREIGRLITRIENGSEPAFKDRAETTIVGVTGSPGSGKSTLVSAIAKTLVESGKRVGVVAVDPSSPLSGGAILGDRIRLSFSHENLFFRSVATRGMRSVSKSTYAIAKVLGANGYGIVFIETVGGGQEDYDVCAISDLVLLVLSPNSGDSIQMLKSGIMELADVFVMNKSDIEGSEMFYSMLKQGFPDKKVFRTIAIRNSGVDEIASLVSSWKGTEDHRKEAVIRNFLATMLKEELFSVFVRENKDLFDEEVRAVARREKDLYEAIAELKKASERS
jgi:LAO/AO transport system kinase